jgi:hypothetical protein
MFRLHTFLHLELLSFGDGWLSDDVLGVEGVEVLLVGLVGVVPDVEVVVVVVMVLDLDLTSLEDLTIRKLGHHLVLLQFPFGKFGMSFYHNTKII